MGIHISAHVYLDERCPSTFQTNCHFFNELLDRSQILSHSDLDAFLGKVDEQGALIWIVSMGDKRADTVAGIGVDKIGSAFIVGKFSPENHVDPSVDLSPKAFITKFDSSGNRGWSRFFGQDGSVDGRKIALDLDSKIYISGEYTSINATIDGFSITNSAVNDIFLGILTNASTLSSLSFVEPRLLSNNVLQTLILGERDQEIAIESSSNLITWSFFKNLTIGVSNQTSFELNISDSVQQFFRAHNVPAAVSEGHIQKSRIGEKNK